MKITSKAGGFVCQVFAFGAGWDRRGGGGEVKGKGTKRKWKR